jgi:SAM-dependent methyltransferase
MSPLNSETVYKNQGNRSILQFLDEDDRFILDVGCGVGSNGRLVHQFFPLAHVTGVTCSHAEYQEASKHLGSCIHADLERDNLNFQHRYDVLLFSHVLEHLIDPISVLKKLLPSLRKNGKVIILLPNIANFRTRWMLARGKFEYTKGGVMDETHLRFYTFYTACRYLVDPLPQLEKVSLTVRGSIPLGPFRHYLLHHRLRKVLDEIGCSLYPNLFGGEIIIYARHVCD